MRGDTVEQIRSALRDLLHANGIAREVSQIAYGGLGSVNALLFHVDGISLPIKNIAFSDEAAVTDKQLSDASVTLRNQDFSVTNVASYASSGLLPPYCQRGYLRSKFGRVEVKLVDANSKGPTSEVSITLPVTEGNQYLWNGAPWTGNQVLSTGDLAKLLGMNQPEVANQEKIDAGLAAPGKPMNPGDIPTFAFRLRGTWTIRRNWPAMPCRWPKAANITWDRFISMACHKARPWLCRKNGS